MIGLAGHLSIGFKDIKNREMLQAAPIISDDIFLLGDSHAGHLAYGLSKVTWGRLIDRSDGGCVPFRNVDRYDSRQARGECVARVNAALDELAGNKKPKTIILSMMGPVYLDGTPFNGKDWARVTGFGLVLTDNKAVTDRWQVFEVGMRRTLRELSRLQNTKVVFVIDIPELGIDYGCDRGRKSLYVAGFKVGDLIRPLNPSECKITRTDYEARSAEYKKFIYSIAKDYPSVLVFDPTQMFCDQRSCYGYRANVGYLYKDQDHLSSVGSLDVARKLAGVLRAADED